jgi:hypothetical protein
MRFDARRIHAHDVVSRVDPEGAPVQQALPKAASRLSEEATTTAVGGGPRLPRGWGLTGPVAASGRISGRSRGSASVSDLVPFGRVADRKGFGGKRDEAVEDLADACVGTARIQHFEWEAALFGLPWLVREGAKGSSER